MFAAVYLRQNAQQEFKVQHLKYLIKIGLNE